jgi:hypothetical protein
MSDSEEALPVVDSGKILDKLCWESVLRMQPLGGLERDPFATPEQAFTEYDRLNYGPHGVDEASKPVPHGPRLGILANGLALVSAPFAAFDLLRQRPHWRAAPVFQNAACDEVTFIFRTCGQADVELEFHEYAVRVRSWYPSQYGFPSFDRFCIVPPEGGSKWIIPVTCYKAHLPSSPPEIHAALEAASA